MGAACLTSVSHDRSEAKKRNARLAAVAAGLDPYDEKAKGAGTPPPKVKEADETAAKAPGTAPP